MNSTSSLIGSSTPTCLFVVGKRSGLKTRWRLTGAAVSYAFVDCGERASISRWGAMQDRSFSSYSSASLSRDPIGGRVVGEERIL